MQLSGVRPSVRLCVRAIRPPHAATAGLLLWARQPGDIDRLLQRRAADECGLFHIVSVHSS